MTDPLVVLAALPLALLLDRLLGEPPWLWTRLPHPVVLIGRCIDLLERRLNRPELSDPRRRRRGLLALAALVSAGTVLGLVADAALPATPAGIAAEAALASVFFAQKSLVQHVAAVADGLVSAGLHGGRKAVALIVGRDVEVLDEPGVARAAIESAAENFSDGLMAPVFWFAVLGLPGLLVYKIANTADSMIGHRSERFAAFGWAAARFDDTLNLLPARLAALVLALPASAFGTGRAALAASFRDASRHRSPNAGWPEAAMAGALGLALGGPRRYGVQVVDGAWLNASGRRDAGAADIRAAVRLIDAAWGLIFGLATITALALALWPE